MLTSPINRLKHNAFTHSSGKETSLGTEMLAILASSVHPAQISLS